MTITTQAVREMAERLRSHVNARGGSSLGNGFWQRAINASDMLLALVEERDRLAEANAKKADDIVTLGQLVGEAEARAEAAEAALRESEANRILLDALVAELKAEKQPTLGRFATLLRRATTKVNRAALQGRDGDG